MRLVSVKQNKKNEKRELPQRQFSYFSPLIYIIGGGYFCMYFFPSRTTMPLKSLPTRWAFRLKHGSEDSPVISSTTVLTADGTPVELILKVMRPLLEFILMSESPHGHPTPDHVLKLAGEVLLLSLVTPPVPGNTSYAVLMRKKRVPPARTIS